MGKQKLIEYVKTIYEMESSLFMMDDLLTQMEEKSKSIRSYKETPTYAYEAKPKNKEVAVAWIVLPFLTGVFAGLFNPNKILGLLIYGTIGLIIGIILSIIISNIKFTRRLKEWEEHQTETAIINTSIIEQNKRENTLYQQKADLLDNEISKLEEKNNETINLLNAYYDLNIIYPKYRNLIAISSIYEYLLSGKCHELTGPGGAYATYDLESRLDYIIVRLDDVIEKLDQIQNNQYQLYDAINNGFKQSNALLNDIAHGIDRLETSQELNTYYNRITARNSEYFRMVHFYNGTI